jgi:hypothetical protein
MLPKGLPWCVDAPKCHQQDKGLTGVRATSSATTANVRHDFRQEKQARSSGVRERQTSAENSARAEWIEHDVPVVAPERAFLTRS